MRSTYNFDGVDIMVQKDGAKTWFHRNAVAKALGLEKLSVMKKHIKKVKIETVWPDVGIVRMVNIHGLNSMVYSSKPVSRREKFIDWVHEVVLPSVTGDVAAGETRLHYKVVRYVKKHYPDVIIIPGLDENQDSRDKRLDSCRKGYKAGQPDIILAEPCGCYIGMAIELKTPNGCGVLSEEQSDFLHRLDLKSYHTLVSHDYYEVCECVDEYMKGRV